MCAATLRLGRVPNGPDRCERRRCIRRALRHTIFEKASILFNGVKKDETKKGANDIDTYNKMHDHHGGDADERKKGYVDLVNSYYNLATDFYEIGWGQSFHFANRFKSGLPRRALAASIALQACLQPLRAPQLVLTVLPALIRRDPRRVDRPSRVLPGGPPGNPALGPRARLRMRHRRPAAQPGTLHRRLHHGRHAEPVPGRAHFQ